jgi:hypothetical protein
MGITSYLPTSVSDQFSFGNKRDLGGRFINWVRGTTGAPDQANLDQATADAQQRARDFYSHLALINSQYQQALGQQNNLGTTLDRTIAGTGPSVAQNQLQQGLGQVRQQAESEASGTTGQNSALARYAAIMAGGNAAAQTNQQAAGLRAEEVARAEAAKAGLLNNEQAAIGGMYGANTTGANAAGGQAIQGSNAEAQINLQNTESNRQLASNLVQAGGQGAAKMFGSDEREKENVKGISDPEMDAFLKHLSGFSFDYKPGAPNASPGHRAGVMAQDVQEGGPIGKSLVLNGKRLALDSANSIGAVLAAVGYLNKKIDHLKAA